MSNRFASVSLLAISLLVATRAAERPLILDPDQSRVEIAVKATVDSFVAKLGRYELAANLAEDGRVHSARLAFRFSDIATGKKSRDKAMHEWQHTEQYPDGGFVLSTLEPAGANAFTAFGRITLHGVTREIQFPVTISRDGDRYGIDGDATLDTREFGLPVIRMFGVLKVDPLVHVRFHLQGTAAAGKGPAL